MRPLIAAAALVGLAAAAAPEAPPQAILSNPAPPLARRIPTTYESAAMGRRILALSKLATFSTVYPASASSDDAAGRYHGADTWARQPEGLAGVPVGLMEYVADCEPHGNPTVLAIKIGTHFRNVRAGSNLTIALRWTPPYPPARRIPLLSRLASVLLPLRVRRPHLPPPPPPRPEADAAPAYPDTVPYSAANLPRFSLFGHLEPVEPSEAEAGRLAACYTDKHPDAKHWLPGNKIHASEWMRFVVSGVYWVGGFGDRAYIGWIPVAEWKSVTADDWQSIRLPGEKPGWDENEWSSETAGEL